MKIFSLSLIIFLSLPFLSYSKDIYVPGYIRKNGTSVAPYHRSAPNSTVRDNYDYKGNTNPYTGEEGHNYYRDNQSSEYYNTSPQLRDDNINNNSSVSELIAAHRMRFPEPDTSQTTGGIFESIAKAREKKQEELKNNIEMYKTLREAGCSPEEAHQTIATQQIHCSGEPIQE